VILVVLYTFPLVYYLKMRFIIAFCFNVSPFFYLPFAIAQQTQPSANATAACQLISQGSADTHSWPLGLTNLDYLDAKNHYWSATNSDLTPACAVFPTTAAELSYVVKSLLEYPDVHFAVKSGGHNTNVGFSSKWHRDYFDPHYLSGRMLLIRVKEQY